MTFNMENRKLSLYFRAADKRQIKVWRELSERRHEFQNILSLLVEHEKNAPHLDEHWLSYLRQSLCVCNPNLLRIFLCDLGAYLFHVVCQLEETGARMATAWMHEDGIQAERDFYIKEDDHPIHSVVCMTDFYHNHTREIIMTNKKQRPSVAALYLMLEE